MRQLRLRVSSHYRIEPWRFHPPTLLCLQWQTDCYCWIRSWGHAETNNDNFPLLDLDRRLLQRVRILVSVDFHIFPISIGNIVNISRHNVTEQMLMHDWNSTLILNGIITDWKQTDGRTERSADRAIDRHPDIGKLNFRFSSEIMFLCCE